MWLLLIHYLLHTQKFTSCLKGLLLFQSIMIPIRLSVLAFSDNFWRQKIKKLRLKLIFSKSQNLNLYVNSQYSIFLVFWKKMNFLVFLAFFEKTYWEFFLKFISKFLGHSSSLKDIQILAFFEILVFLAFFEKYFEDFLEIYFEIPKPLKFFQTYQHFGTFGHFWHFSKIFGIFWKFWNFWDFWIYMNCILYKSIKILSS